MLDIEKTLQSVRDLLDRLGKEGVEFALVESEYSDYVADIRNPNKVYVFLECSIRPNGTFVWRDYDHLDFLPRLKSGDSSPRGEELPVG